MISIGRCRECGHEIVFSRLRTDTMYNGRPCFLCEFCTEEMRWACLEGHVTEWIWYHLPVHGPLIAN